MATPCCKSRRTGGVYIAVLGTSMIVALLGLSALMAQRVQNRMLAASADIRQAQLNAHSAVELALLTMKQDENWRTNYANGVWFADRTTGAGTCTVSVTDPVDSNLANNADDPVVVVGIGYRGQAEQRVEVTVDPRREPLGCLRSAIAVGDAVSLNSDILRTTGLITANSISVSGSQVYGSVEALSITGSTYNGTTTVITSDKRPTMPNWTDIVSYYRTNGTQISIGSLPTSTPNLGRNVSFDSNAQFWTGSGAGLPTASITREVNTYGHAACLRVHNRSANTAGASQYIDHFVKPGASYNISIQIAAASILGNTYRVKLATKGSGAVQTSVSGYIVSSGTNWTDVSVNLTAPSWSGQLEYARVTIDTDAPLGKTDTFYLDNLDIRENTSGRFIYRQVLGPGVNPFGAQTNAQGIYWINCNGSRLVIERSRIHGTLLVINPGSSSCIAEGPISWSPRLPAIRH